MPQITRLFFSVFVMLVFALLPASQVHAQFVDVAASSGITTPHDGQLVTFDMGLGVGAAWFDYDNDGDLDLYMTMRQGANLLYQNNSGSFTDVAVAAGAADASHDGAGVVAADFNNDGCKDLYLANSNEDVILQNNCDGTFTDVTVGSGLDASGARRGTSASVGDYDGDGLLDLYVAHHMPIAAYGVPDNAQKDQDYLFHNDGSFTFTDVSDDMLGVSERENASFISAWTDFDNDGDLDIYLIRDCGFDGSGAMDLWRNDGGTDGVTDWTFTEVASTVNGNWCQNGMGVAVGDYDRNGFMDLFYTDNGAAPGGVDPNRAGTILLANSATGFTDETDAAGVNTLNFSWGANFFDYNLDGFLDLFMAAGAVNDASALIEAKLWESNGGAFTFSDVSVAQGVNDTGRGRAAVYADYDADGDPDLFYVNYAGDVKLWRNDNGGSNNWLIIDLEGVTSNRDGIGARIELTSAGGTQHFETRSGSSLGGGDDTGAYFGIGSDDAISSVQITWPSGTVQTLNNVSVNQRMKVVEAAGTTNFMFSNVASLTGTEVIHNGATDGDMPVGTGAAWFDYDNDGDLDLYMTNREGSNWLFQNTAGSFTNVAASAGVEDATGTGAGVAVADYNNDGCVDIYLANSHADVLFENNCNGTFTDITTGSGLEASEERRGTSASWGDYDQDGLLDLYVAHHMPSPAATFTGDSEQDYVFHNNGDGTFTDVSDELLGTDRVGRGFIAGWTDYDNDGDLDIYNVRDCPFGANSGPMRLYRNDGGTDPVTDWTMTQVAETVGADWCQNGMGLAVGDYNRDGNMDLFFTDNGANTTDYPASPNRVGSVLLRNDGGTFTEQTDFAGVDNSQFSWGANFFDFDNDMFQDLYMVAGAMDPAVAHEGMLWQNDGDGTFTDVSAASGGLNDPLNTRTSAFADYDGDGDLDMFLVNYGQQSKLFRNDNTNSNNWIAIDLQGVASNRDGIGARVELETPDGVTQHYEIRSGSSLGAGDDQAAYFGLGMNASITSATITWPSGIVQVETGLGINQRHLVVENVAPPAALFSDVTTSAGVNVLHDGGTLADMGLGTGAAWFDYDNDGDQDLYVTMRTGANFLYQNNGGVFTDVAAAAGVQDASNDGAGVAVADYDNDGDKDLFLANSDNDVLFENNGNGTFTDITLGSGLESSEERRGTSASWGDYDQDGFVDLYVAHHMNIAGNTATGATEQIKAQDYIYHNNGDGTFTDVSDMLMGTTREGMGFIGGWTDYDSDGDLDVFVVHDCPFDNTSPEQVYRNDGGTDGVTDWTFTEVGSTVNGDWCQNGMGLAVGDYDRDGDFDLFFSDNGSDGTVPVGQMGRAGTMLLRNDAGTFTDATDIAGVSSVNWSWGANFFDYNNDGFQDLYLAAGSMNSDTEVVESVLWENDGDATFTDVSASSGGLNDPTRTRTSVYSDYDQDGDLDMFLVNYGGDTKLFSNNDNGINNWVAFDLEGVTSNRDGIGARLELLTSDGVTQYYETRSGSSLGGGDDLVAHFGIGAATSITSLTINWPSGIVQIETSLGMNQRHLIVESGIAGGVLTVDPASVDFGQINEGSSSSPQTMTLTNAGVAALDVTSVTITGTDAGDFTHTFAGGPVTIAAGSTSNFDVTFSPMASTAPTMQLPEGVLYRVNAGGALVDDWEEDSGSLPSSYLLAGSTNIETDTPTPTLDASVPAGTPTDLFTAMRLDANQPEPFMEWDFPVTIGEEYQVRLFFVEMSRCSVGNRVFDVEIEGTIVEDNIDVFTEAGSACNVGIMREYTITATDANLDINFPLENGKPSVLAAIEILGSDGTTTDPRAAQLMIDHTGTNPSLNVDLSGESVTSTGGGSVLSVNPVSIDFGQIQEGVPSAPTTVTLTNTGTASVDVTAINVTGTNAGDFSHDLVAPVTVAGGGTSTFDVTFTPVPSAGPEMALPEGVLFRVNAGGSLVDDWEEDSATTPSAYLLAGSTSIESDTPTPTLDASVPVGTPTDLFTTMRLDADQPEPFQEWDFPVTAGEEIEVRLYFVEMSRCSVGNRVFDIQIEGVTVLEDLDIFAEAGDACNVGIMREFTVTPLDANLDITFPLENGKPSALAAIEIVGSDGTSTSLRSAQITIDNTSLAPVLTVDLAGEAVTTGGPTLVATPLDIDFGQVDEGTASTPMSITLTNNSAEAIDVTTVTITGTDAGDFSHNLTTPVTVGASSTSNFDVTFTPAPSAAPEGPEKFAPGDVLYRVNSGGGNIDDWEKDSQNGPSAYVLPGCCNTESEPVAATADATVPAGTPLGIFESIRKDANQPDPVMEWAFPVTANVTYEVNLYFAELSRCSVGNRIFDIEIEGTIVQSGFDIYAEAGSACNVGTMRSYLITPTDAEINVRFPLVNGKPSAIAGLEVIEAITNAPDVRTAQVNIEHTGTNGTQIVQLTGEATENPNSTPVADFSADVNDLTVTFTDASTDDGTITSWAWDFGDTNSSTDQNPVHIYTAYGTYSVTLTVTDDLGNIGAVTQDVLVADPNATGPYIEQNGMLVIEAENFDTNTDNGDMWVETTSEADFSGSGAMVTEPNDGTLIRKNNVSTSPHMTYDVDVTTTGSYIVWARLFAPTGNDNTVHVGLDDFPTNDKMETLTTGSWIWTNIDTKGALQTMGITTAGLHTIDVWMREDGTLIDKIILTTDAGFVPTGHGPAESPRSSGVASKSKFGKDLFGVTSDLPEEFALKANYPNPFNPTTTIAFDVPEATDVTLEVYDMMGRRVATLINGQLNAGRYEAVWNARSDAGSMVASGVYIYRLRAGSFESVKQMVLMK